MCVAYELAAANTWIEKIVVGVACGSGREGRGRGQLREGGKEGGGKGASDRGREEGHREGQREEERERDLTLSGIAWTNTLTNTLTNTPSHAPQDSVDQLQRNARTFGSVKPLTAEQYKHVNRVVDSLGLTEQVVSPNLWPPR